MCGPLGQTRDIEVVRLRPFSHRIERLSPWAEDSPHDGENAVGTRGQVSSTAKLPWRPSTKLRRLKNRSPIIGLITMRRKTPPFRAGISPALG